MKQPTGACALALSATLSLLSLPFISAAAKLDFREARLGTFSGRVWIGQCRQAGGRGAVVLSLLAATLPQLLHRTVYVSVEPYGTLTDHAAPEPEQQAPLAMHEGSSLPATVCNTL